LIVPLQSGVEDMMTNRGFVLLLFALLAGSGDVVAQPGPSAEQLYSSGVQAFNVQRYAEAIGFFNTIEGLGTQDPRAFFFRGLSYSRAGNAVAAAVDYETAARMELTVAGRSYSVPKALERIQGRERTVIEQYRRAAKRAWEAEQNLRKQEEFLSQKAEDMKFYQSIIESGKPESLSPKALGEVSDLPLPFGAQPVTPFVANPQTFRSRTAPGVSQGGLSEDNQFFHDVNRVTPVETPEDTVPKAPTRLQDPNERGVFDFDNDDEVPGFDVSFQQPGGRSVPGSMGVSNFGGGNDDDDFYHDFDDGPNSMAGSGAINSDFGDMIIGGLLEVTNTTATKESGRSFSNGFAGLFKKSGSGGASSSQPSITPSNQRSAFDDFGDDVNPFDEFDE